MARAFLNQLPMIPRGELSKESSCMICYRQYSKTSVDIAVRLPCSHHVGLECISTWLSQDSRNSCPMCRRVFFEVVDEEEEEQHYRVIMSRVGRPPQEQHGPESSLTWQGIQYDYFVSTAAEHYERSLREARAFFERRSESCQPHHIEYHATAFRTLAAREMFLYTKFAREGALPPVVAPIRGPLNAAQLEALFQELRLRGAFDVEFHPFRCYHNLTDREMWLKHREEGESYSTWEGGYWSLSLG